VRVDGGVPNARQTHDLTAHERSKPYNGFHRAVLPKLLGGSSESGGAK
jgi:citronellol/citronellal dehydrogenase